MRKRTIATAFAAALVAAPLSAHAVSFFTPQYKKETAACTEALEKGDHQTAIAAGRRAAELKPNYFESRYCLGKAYAKADLPQPALKELYAALPLAPSPNNTMVVNSDIAQLLQREGDYVKALEHYDTALAYAIVLQDRRTKGITLANIAATFEAQGKEEKALEYYRRAVAEGEEADAGAAFSNMGNILFARKEYDAALDAYQNAALIAAKGKNDLLNGIALLNMGNVLLTQKKFPAAEKNLSQGMEAVQKGNNPYWEAVAHEYFGRYYAAAGLLQKARESFTEARARYTALGAANEARQMELRLKELEANDPLHAPSATPLPSGDGLKEETLPATR